MPKGPDPRADALPLDAVPRLLREGAGEFGAHRFWHAHEAWEGAWHALRRAGEAEAAAYVRGLILVCAALENAARDKEAGFKRQMAEGLFALKSHPEGPRQLRLKGAPAFEDALVLLYTDACRRLDWRSWRAGPWTPPPPPEIE